MSRHEFRVLVTVDGETRFEQTFETLEPAVRAWDQATYSLRPMDGVVRVQGGVQVQTFNEEGLMVRDGWILHLFDGVPYLNPNIALTT